MPQPADTSRLIRRGKEGETQVVVGGLGRSNQRQAVPRRAGHQVWTTRRLEHLEEPVRLRQGLLGGPAVIQGEAPIGQAADVYADRARVEAYDAGHDAISSWPALFWRPVVCGCRAPEPQSALGQYPRWLRRPAPGRFGKRAGRRRPCAAWS